MKNDTLNDTTVPWKRYLILTCDSLLTFYLATFCMAVFFAHRGTNWLIPGIILCLLYVFVIIACAKRVIQSVSLAALMIIVPIAPLIALFIVISLIPILQKL